LIGEEASCHTSKNKFENEIKKEREDETGIK
jgi:hypothetical protein